MAGYNLHYGYEESGVYTELLDVGMATEAAVPDQRPGQIYYCAVTAYNSYGLESDYSNEVVFICPTESPLEGPDDRLIVLSSGNDYWLAPTAAPAGSEPVPADVPPPMAYANVHFEVGFAASYVIWCRLQVTEGISVPLALSVDGGPEQLFYPTATLPSGDPGWLWARLETATGDPQFFELSAGTHMLDLRSLEDIQIDRIAMSSDPDFVPSPQLSASGDAVSLTQQPQGGTVMTGRGTTLRAVAVGTAALYFQWYKDGELMHGQTAPILTINPASPADSGDYTVLVWSGTALIASEPALLEVIAAPPPPRITAFSIDQDRQVSFQIQGDVGTFLSVYASDDLINWSLIGGQINSDGSIIVPDPAAAALPRRFYRLGSNAGEK